MSKLFHPFSLLNDEQSVATRVVEHQPVKFVDVWVRLLRLVDVGWILALFVPFGMVR